MIQCSFWRVVEKTTATPDGFEPPQAHRQGELSQPVTFPVGWGPELHQLRQTLTVLPL